MKLAVITDEISRDIVTSLEILQSKDIKYLELRSLRSGRVPYITNKEEIELRRYLCKYGYKINAISPAIGKLNISESDLRRKTIEHLKDSIDFAKRNDITRIIVFSFRKLNKYDTNEKTPNIVYDLLDEMISIGEENEIEILLENHSSCYISTIDTINRLYEDSRFKNRLKLNWDPNNSFQVDKKMYQVGDFNKFFKCIENVHVKDTSYTDKFIRNVVGEGQVGWENILKDLQKVGYCNTLTIETHYEPYCVNAIKDIDSLRKMIILE